MRAAKSVSDGDLEDWQVQKSGIGASTPARRSPVSFHTRPDNEPASVAWAISCRLLLVVASFAMVSCSTLSSLRNPKVKVEVDNPADIGLDVSKIAFALPQGLCSAAIVGGLTQSLMSKDMEVLSDTTGVAGPGAGVTGAGVARGGAPAGRSLLLSLNDTVCDSDRDMSSRQVKKTRKKTRMVDGKEEKYKETYTDIEFTFRTRFNLGVSARAADLETGVVVDVRDVAHSSANSARGIEGGYGAGFPPVAPLRDAATAAAERELSRWLLPWTETVNLVFYDAEECGMKTAHSHLQRGDVELALDRALTGIELCDSSAETDDRFRAAAYYNAGIAYFIGGEHDEALRLLRTAQTIDPENTQVADAMEQALRARALSAEIHQIHGRGAVAPGDGGGAGRPEQVE